MVSKKNLILAVGMAAGLAVAGSAMAADGGALYNSKGCTMCHGANGDKPIAPSYPILAGQNSTYLLNQMKDIKSGARSNGQTAAMKPIIGQVSDDEMQAIADWLSKQKR